MRVSNVAKTSDAQCVHCKSRKSHRRGLCHACHERPEIRSRYPYRLKKPVLNRPDPCVHCGLCPGWATRGLCRKCARIQRVREEYGITTREPEPDYSRLTECQPTQAQPGSEAKIQVLTQRHASGQHLHHPQDAGVNRSGLLTRRAETIKKCHVPVRPGSKKS